MDAAAGSPDEGADARPSDAQPTDAQRRQSFGAWAADYDRYRPGYPEPAVQWLLEPLSGTPRVRVVDLGAGTGLLAGVLAGLGHDVVAVEPDPRMRAVAAERLAPERVLAGQAERIPLPDASVDAVLVAQAWHWVDPTAAVPEVARVLRPGGVLGIVWNLRDDRVPWVAELTALLGLQDARGGYRDEAPPPLDPQLFAPADTAEVPHPVPADADRIAGTVATYSLVRLRPDADAAVEQARDLAARHAGPDGTLVLPYVTRCYRALRRPAPSPPAG